MSEYLKGKLMANLRQAKESLNEVNGTESRERILEGKISEMKSKIGDMRIHVESDITKEQVEHTPRYEGAELAEVAIDVYRSNINPNRLVGKPQINKPANQPMTPAKREHIKAMARTLTGMRNGGDCGETSYTAGPNGGDSGSYSPPAGPNGGNSTGMNTTYPHTYAMSVEEYEDYIKDVWGLNEKKMPPDDKVNKAPSPKQSKSNKMEDAIHDLETDLKESGASDWVSIDKMMRSICSQYGYTPKELHKAFKSKHGMIPDEWIREQVEYGIAGWFPLTEAQRLYKQGMVYEVSLMWKGQNRRIKFFWPELEFPSRASMQEASDKFYPGSRLLSYYKSHDDVNNNFMVIVPPFTEEFEYIGAGDWDVISEAEVQMLDLIEENEGQVVTPIQYDGDESFVTIEEYNTGELKQITFNEGSLHAWFNKSKSKDGKPGWVQSDGSPCANEKGETKTPKCYSSSKLKSMSKSEVRSADSRKSRQDPNQQSKSGAAKPTYVSTDKPSKKNEEYVVEFIGGKPGDGYIGHPNLDIKNPFAKTQNKGPTGNKGVAGKLGDRKMKMDAMIKKMGEEYVSEGDKKGKGSGKKDACYHKVKARFKVWPSAYGSGALVKCRQKGADNWGNSSKKEEYEVIDERACWKTHRKVGMKMKGGKLVNDCRPKNEEYVEEGKKQAMTGPALPGEPGRPGTPKAPGGRPHLPGEKQTPKPNNPGSPRLPGGLRLAHYDYDDESGESLDELKCWKGYRRKPGSKPGAPGSCVKELADASTKRIMDKIALLDEAAWTKKEGQNSEGGLNEKGRKSYERENPGSDLKAPTKEKGSKRRKSFCARMKGMRKRQKPSNNTGEDRLSKSLKKWDC